MNKFIKIIVPIITVILLFSIFIIFSTTSKKDIPKETIEETTSESNDEQTTTEEAKVTAHFLHIDTLLQFPELPMGCEAVSLTNCLNYFGFNLDKFYIVDNYLCYYSNDYQIGFRGSPYLYSGQCTFPKSIVDTANKFLKDRNSKLVAYETSGTEFEDLIDIVNNNIPIIIWATVGYEYPTFSGEIYSYDIYSYANYYNEHCILLCGYDLDRNIVQVSNPYIGIEEVNMQLLKEVYNNCGKLSVVIK